MVRQCVIVCAGEMDIQKTEKRPEALVIAVDGGLRYCGQLGWEPDYCIGDFDSIEEEQKKWIEEMERQKPERVKRLQPEKDDTDTLAALRLGLSLGCLEFFIYGGLGGRFEHSLANIQSLLFLKRQGAWGYLMEKNGISFILSNEEWQFPADKKGFLSLFALGERAEGVDIVGMKYPLQKAVITQDFPVGIDNEFIGEKALVRVRRGNLLVICREM